ncbi:UTP--glucose-1-phosphate uridylyltransferase [Pedosphaera parvula]|uniref:UTP--glucose-1-phosphate uridylyltransferase n=1 Tax=Pedosphaera parvula (strain Ellin514) TaxID=320771 RepID=B9XHR8_PEDPL|nr:UTP--glucose-1-phosphate uridylyltransferase [Pedosphaera parvula]EEF60646.1 UTP--glucose-1-phosphate uridylyltransferase [Pedosphaera parvula Ellin514]
MSDSFLEYANKMRGADLNEAAIRAFKHSYDNLVAGQSGMIPESSIQPVVQLPRFEEMSKGSGQGELLSQAVVVKLNGGLGTSMGLEKAKSLLQLKDGLTFLDFIAKQILYLRQQHGSQLRFLLMDSFSTSKDTLDFLKKYPELGEAQKLELMQSAVPKVDAKTLRPVEWPANRELEWCPPGHGDLYPSLLGSGWLERLLAGGVKYMFVSNSDNLGASLDLDLLSYFAKSNQPFLMEVCERTASDKKGGHLAQRNGKLLLRESAQCPEEDMAAFQDISKHRFFNTNNLWVRLDKLKELLDATGGFIKLPIIKNSKTVDPRDKNSTKVFQLETAMGAAIECFDGAGAIVVPRTRFAPVKTTADLLALRSDAYEVTKDWRLELAASRQGVPPAIDLDSDYYKLVDQLDSKLRGGVPSLAQCRELKVQGPVAFNAKNVFSGKVAVSNKSVETKALPPGEYQDTTREL